MFKAVYENFSTKNKSMCPEDRFIGGTHPKFAVALFIPILLATIFILPHWWRLEGTLRKRIIAFPFVILQCWPQYRMAKILYLGLWKKDNKWKEEEDDISRNVSTIGEKTNLAFLKKKNPFDMYIFFIYCRASN